VSDALGQVSVKQVSSSQPSLTEGDELMKSNQAQEAQKGRVQTGIDVLKNEKFVTLTGLRVGLITNHSGIDSTGQRTLTSCTKRRLETGRPLQPGAWTFRQLGRAYFLIHRG